MKRSIKVFFLIFLTALVTQAETFPSFQFEDVRGREVLLGAKAEKKSVIVLSKPGRSNRDVNEAWMEALLDKLGKRADLDLFLLADFAGLPGFLDKDKLRKKMLEKSQGKKRSVLETMLFDWHGEARPKLARDSQIAVYVVDAEGEIRETVIGFVKPERVDRVVKAVEKL